jgi:prepilin-type N-terminal cleavage/methylation domain-containing protein
MRLQRRGHTLMETMVVVAIILIAIGILMPCYFNALKMARKTAGQNDTRYSER